MTLKEFMDKAADHGVTFKVESDADGFRFAVGWPHAMPPEARQELQGWVDAHSEELATKLLEMTVEVSKGKPGLTIITPEHTTLQ